MDLTELLKAAQTIKERMGRVKEELATKTVDGESGGGMVRCTVNGKGDVLSLTIDESLLPGLDERGRKMIEDLTVGAVNVALDRAKETAQKELASATGGLPLPPGFLNG